MTRSSQAIVMKNVRMGGTNSRNKKLTELAPTAKCFRLDALETVSTSTGETARDEELPEDLWPNFNAMVTRLQQLYIGNHEEN